MKVIAAVDKNWAIGYKGELLVSLPEDQKDTFRLLTLGNTIIYGRKTLDTFPGQKLLPGRTNIIMSRSHSFKKEGALVLHSKEEVLTYNRQHENEEIYIIGGAEIYRTFLQYCSEAIVSRIDHSFKADVYLSNLDNELSWKEVSRSDVIHSIKGYDFTVHHYRNLNMEY